MASMRVNAVFAGVLTLLVAWCVSLPAHAFVLKQTSSGATVRWARSDVVLDLDASILAIPDVERRLNAAIRLWRGSASAPRVRLGSRVSTTPKVDGRNVLFLRDGYPPVNGALGITLLSFDESTGNIVDADIVINPRYSFRTQRPPGRRWVHPGSGAEWTPLAGATLDPCAHCAWGSSPGSPASELKPAAPNHLG
jgi:hypothetical protein